MTVDLTNEADVDWLEENREEFREEADAPPPDTKLATKGQWMPYTGPRGGSGWQDTDTGEVVYQEEPPGVTVGDDPAEDPAKEGDRVMLEYDGERHFGEVIGERPNGEVTIQDDRNNWSLAPDESEQYGGDMRMWNLGAPESDQQDPNDADLTDPDDIAYAIDGQGSLDASLNKVSEALQETDVDTVFEALEQSNELQSFSAADMLMERHGVAETGDGKVALDARQGDYRSLVSAFEDEYGGELSGEMASVEAGWVGDMYRDKRSGPLVQHARDETGNENMPEYEGAGRADWADVSESETEAVEAMDEFTTEKLREAFGDEVVVFRGLSEAPHQGTPSEGTSVVEKLREAKKSGEAADIDHRPVESWSLNPQTAGLYAGSGMAIKQTIPVEDAVMSSSAGGISPIEEDTVVKHDGAHRYDPDDIYDMGSNGKDSTTKMRLEAVKGAQK